MEEEIYAKSTKFRKHHYEIFVDEMKNLCSPSEVHFFLALTQCFANSKNFNLKEYEKFKQDVWLNYLSEIKTEAEELSIYYKEIKKELQKRQQMRQQKMMQPPNEQE